MQTTTECKACGRALDGKFKHDGNLHDNCKATMRNVGMTASQIRENMERFATKRS